MTFRLMRKPRPDAGPSSEFQLDVRQGLPPEWFLFQDISRGDWLSHENYGPVSELWLNRHDGFRNMGNILINQLKQYRENQLPAERFSNMLAPQLQRFLSELHTHNMVEDQQYFPALLKLEPDLLPGLELLEADHAQLHQRMEAVVLNATQLFTAVRDKDLDAIRGATDAYERASVAMLMGLKRHLTDEEDLIMPVLLGRGEADVDLS
ncbi:hemerythrin domain-containing protein [Roseibium sp. MMSF_3412]|uniref:hemerythrin domain-containing protein n=1 Tax=Roseibium sp. MMSF_3412 TaxID=3046712 RepID=UPI00273FC30D|nr:hemerythrin domain-containing protein [Roseibium sp. MMSF_3412]